MVYLLWVMTLLLLIASLLPFSKVAHGVIRGLDFPRIQFFGLALLLMCLFPFGAGGPALLWAEVVLGAVALLQLGYIAKFTPLWARQSVDATPAEQAQQDGVIRLLAANVKLSNRAYNRLCDLVEARVPDVVMAIEVDQDWIEALRGRLGAAYAHVIEVPQDNGYGLCVLSRLPLSDIKVTELITQGVPSIATCLTLRDGRKVRLFVVHPEPPVIHHDTIGRDSEMALIGMQAANDPLPAIVSGDLNDVAWSTTTRRFQRLSGLLDPRVGRGFYNTFSATMPWMRWPLDHLFHDPQFRLVEMARLPKIGSDHFPMWFVLALTASPAQESDPGEAAPGERREMLETIVKERARDREAIGSDWEDGAT